MVRPQEFDRRNVLNRAMTLFWNKGYDATSLSDLLIATGLSKSSLYGSFGDKRELFLEAYDTYREERAREMSLILGAGPADKAIRAFFAKIIEDAALVAFSNGCMSTNQAVELAPRDSAVKSRVDEDFKLIEEAFFETIQRGQKEGSVSPKADARAVASMFAVAFPGFQVMVRAGTAPRRLETALNQLLSNLE